MHSRVEIVGLRESSGGRSCSLHARCGEHVAVGNLVRFKYAIVDGSWTILYHQHLFDRLSQAIRASRR
jgi:hypothetical protein